jgi:putative hydrolase of the HAD superfamily
LPTISAIFWDIGGVLLSNAWDRHERDQAYAKFALDPVEFEDRHELVVSSWERGRITLDEYLDRTVFYRPRTFTRETFRDYMFSLSQPNASVLALARKLAASGNYLMVALNNESLELNLYRIQQFGLRDILNVFVSSCFVGFRKPEQDIYRLALQITQRRPEETCFIDDRALNLECARRLGMHTIQMQTIEELLQELEALQIVVG